MNKVELLVSKNSEFIAGSYNGIEVIIRKSDGYINAKKLCKQFNKKFRKIFENSSWQAYFNEFCKEYGFHSEKDGVIYELKKGYSQQYSGNYIDPRLINYIAIWASPHYAVCVRKIMYLINERNQIESKTLEDTIKELTQQLEDAKLKIKNLETQVATQQIEIHDSSVRVKENKRHLYIIEEAGNYKFCADSTKVPPKVYKRYVFPASMNVKKEIGTKLKMSWPYYFTKE